MIHWTKFCHWLLSAIGMYNSVIFSNPKTVETDLRWGKEMM